MSTKKTTPWLPWVITLLLGAAAALLISWQLRPGEGPPDRLQVTAAARARHRGASPGAAGAPPKAAAAPAPPTPTTALPGRVVGPNDASPAAGATVLLDGDPVGVTDEKGELAVDFPADSWAHALFAERGDASSAIATLDLETLPPGAVVLALRAASHLGGQVLDRSGRPAAAVALRLLPGGAPPQTSAQDGRFDFGPLGAGDLLLLAEASDGDRAEAFVRLLPGQRREVVLLLTPGDLLRGQVVDEHGRALAGMTLEAKGELFRARTRSRSDGTFALALTGADPLRLEAHGQGRAGHLEGVRDTEAVTIVATPAAALRVQLAWSDGALVKGARLALHRASDDPESSGLEIFSSGAPGTYRREELEPGTVTVSAAAGGERLGRTLGTLELLAGEEGLLEATLPAKQMQASVFGVVFEAGSSSRTPVAGARVLLINSVTGIGEGEDGRARAVITDSQGRFRFDHIKGEAPGATPEDPLAAFGNPDALPLKVEAEGFAPFLDLLPPNTALDIPLQPRRKVRGRVVDAAGLPLAIAWVAGQEITLQDGVFETALSRTQTSIEVGSPGYAPRRLETPAGPRVDLGSITLEPADSVALQVLTPEGQPAAGARVFLLSNLEFRFHTESAPADAEGQIALIAPTWPVALEANHPAFLPSAPGPLERVEPGARITLRLRTGAFISGTAGGAGRWVYARPAGADPQALPRPEVRRRRLARADAEGRYRLGPLAAGRWVVEVTERLEEGGVARFASVPLDLGAGQEAQLEFSKMHPAASAPGALEGP